MWHLDLALVCGVLLCGVCAPEPVLLHVLRRKVSAARVITADPTTDITAVRDVIRDSRLFPAVTNASMWQTTLFHRVMHGMDRVYTGYQVQNAAVVGCFLAHLNLWESIPHGETWMVFEDDAVIDNETLARVGGVLLSVRDRYYDFINLAPRRVPAVAARSTLSPLLRYCPHHVPGCEILGTTAYLITHDGARKLSAQFRAAGSRVDVPVDVFVAVMRSHMDASFVMGASHEALFRTSRRPSTIGHEFALCVGHPAERRLFMRYVPMSALAVLALLTVLLHVRRRAI